MSPIAERRPVPDWVDSGAASIQGLDLLGLRLPVQAIGNSLLDGVTTITPTIRYVSFRAWIACSFFNSGAADNWKEFLAFAGAAEAAIAYAGLIRNPKVTGLVGSDGARRELQGESGQLPLTALVQQLGVRIYGRPSEQLGISFSSPSKVPGLTRERGLPLAMSISEHLCRTALGAEISKGRAPAAATREDLEEFATVAGIDDLGEGERELLVSFVLPETPRKQELPRIATYAVLLLLSERHGRPPEETDLFQLAMSPTQKCQSASLTAWMDGSSTAFATALPPSTRRCSHRWYSQLGISRAAPRSWSGPKA